MGKYGWRTSAKRKWTMASESQTIRLGDGRIFYAAANAFLPYYLVHWPLQMAWCTDIFFSCCTFFLALHNFPLWQTRADTLTHSHAETQMQAPMPSAKCFRRLTAWWHRTSSAPFLDSLPAECNFSLPPLRQDMTSRPLGPIPANPSI